MLARQATNTSNFTIWEYLALHCYSTHSDDSGGSVGVTNGNGYVDGDGSDGNGGGSGDNDGNDKLW